MAIYRMFRMQRGENRTQTAHTFVHISHTPGGPRLPISRSHPRTASPRTRVCGLRLRKHSRVKTRMVFESLESLRPQLFIRSFECCGALNVAVTKKFLPANPCSGSGSLQPPPEFRARRNSTRMSHVGTEFYPLSRWPRIANLRCHRPCLAYTAGEIVSECWESTHHPGPASEMVSTCQGRENFFSMVAMTNLCPLKAGS
jgi:hypothetical protein